MPLYFQSQAPSVPIEEEGSGGDYTYEDEDEGDSWDEGSGDDSYGNVVKKPKHKDTSSSRGNGGYNGGNVYEQPNNPYDPQPNPGYQDPYNPVQDPYGNSWNNNPNPYENQQIPTTKAVRNSGQNLRESSVNVISRFNMCENREICDWQFSLFFVMFREKPALSCVISFEIGI